LEGVTIGHYERWQIRLKVRFLPLVLGSEYQYNARIRQRSYKRPPREVSH